MTEKDSMVDCGANSGGENIELRYQDEDDNEETTQGKVYDYEANMPIYALSFSNRVFNDRQNGGGKSILMGVGSYLAQYNKL